MQIFKNAFADVATAFETYLAYWNDGRPLVILGHSQGAQHATYLLHQYFDGDTIATNMAGSRRTSELRARLVLALPVGFRLFAAHGETAGGSLADIPACTAVDETGCLIHYRSYSEGYADFGNVADFYIDKVLAAEGYIHRAFALGDDALICVNPATTVADNVDDFFDVDGDAIPSADDIRVLSSTRFLGAVAAQSDDADGRQYYERYYSATCRDASHGDSYLAIGIHRCANEQTCLKDPIPLNGRIALGGLGLHLWDFTLAMGDLVEQVRQRTNIFLAKD